MADLTQTAANVVAGSGAKKSTGVAGGTITAGMSVFRDTADGKYKALNASTEQTAPAGIALCGASNNQPIVVQYDGDINPGATLIVGEIYCASAANPGKIAPITDILAGANYIHVLGAAKDASTLDLHIYSLGVLYNEG